MSRRQLSVAIGDYMHIRELVDGRVLIPGLDLVFVQLEIEQILQREFRFGEWDVSELSFAQYVAMRSHGDTRLLAIPVFPSRVFRHGSVFVSEGTLTGPEQLVGKRVGVPEWVQTAGVWTRGILADEYGVDLTSIEWVQAGLREAGREESVAITLPLGISLSTRPDTTLSTMLQTGEIDAVISARAPAAVGPVRVRPLIPNAQAVEREWAGRTGICPIMHIVVLREDIYERDRWIAQSLVEGFTEAKRRTVAALADPTVSLVPVPWMSDHLAGASAMLGGQEWWPYGVRQNRQTLETFLAYARQQGIASADLTVEALFAPETLGVVKV